MYGTLYQLQPRQGQQRAVLDRLFRWEQEHLQELLEYAPQWHEGEITELTAEAHGL